MSSKLHGFENMLSTMPGFFGVLDENSTYIQVNKEGASWLGFDKPELMMGLNHFSIRCKAVDLADEWVRQDVFTLKAGVPQRFLGYTCYADSIWRFVLGQKSAFYSPDQKKQIFCHFIDIGHLGIFDFSIFLKKKNGLLIKEQFSLTLLKQFPCPMNKKLSPRESECLFFLLRGKTTKQIACLLNLSPKTIDQYIFFLKNKFSCYGKNDLIASAIDLGYMNFIPDGLLIV